VPKKGRKGEKKKLNLRITQKRKGPRSPYGKRPKTRRKKKRGALRLQKRGR